MNQTGERGYLDLLQHILDHGTTKTDRTGVGTKSVFGAQLRFNLADGFPLLTTKRIGFKTLTTELLWFLRGDTHKDWLTERNCHIWDEWSSREHPGTIGPGYGWQWRCYGSSYDPSYVPGWAPSTHGTDQLAEAIHSLAANPDSRRHIVSAWNPEEVGNMALPPCHAMFQFEVSNGKLNCQLYQRSADMFLGVPFNIASYALLVHIIVEEVNERAGERVLAPGEFVWTGGDCHIYLNHVEQVQTQLAREMMHPPMLVISQRPKDHPDDILPAYEPEDFHVESYTPHPSIKAPVAV